MRLNVPGLCGELKRKCPFVAGRLPPRRGGLENIQGFEFVNGAFNGTMPDK